MGTVVEALLWLKALAAIMGEGVPLTLQGRRDIGVANVSPCRRSPAGLEAARRDRLKQSRKAIRRMRWCED